MVIFGILENFLGRLYIGMKLKDRGKYWDILGIFFGTLGIIWTGFGSE